MSEHSVLHLKDYDIFFDNELGNLESFLKKKNYSLAIILVDKVTHQHCLPFLQHQVSMLSNAPVIVVDEGEQHKTLYTCEHIWAEMIRLGADRKSVLINLGGGVIGDMGGFSAACFMRGIDFIQIPTTVLSQVDSSIGGKLGVDFRFGKNLIGAFKNPALVVISEAFLKTLPQRQILNGFAEIFKHGLIRGSIFQEKWVRLEGFPLGIPVDIQKIVEESVSIKKAVVEEDPFEKHLRKILNFGHTIGHAIEAWFLQNSNDVLLHGEAIVAGMIMEAYIGTQIVTDCNLDMEKDVLSTFRFFYKKLTFPENFAAQIFPFMTMDKKNAGGKVLAVVLKSAGDPVIDVEITQELLEKSIQYYENLTWN
jgi:3-dehydroquinate synthase